ncbi:MAG: enoyl-CoA hydratase/isomerase family protein [Burkholderiaceae bacterium]
MSTPESTTAATESPMRYELREARNGRRIGFAILNRPRQLNALNLAMCESMLAQFRAWASDESIAAVVLAGAGDKGFCAGGDVAEVIRQVRGGQPDRFVYGDAFFTVEYELDYLLHTYPKPLVSYSHGINMGGGVGLSVGASHRVVAEGSRIAMPEIHIGLFPDVGGGWFLNRTPGGTGALMALTGVTVNEADAIFAGLADFFVPLESREALFQGLADIDWQGGAADFATVTRLLLAQHQRHHAGLPASSLQQYFDAIRFIAAQPDVIGARDALTAAAGEDAFFARPAESLAGGSPTAAHVTWAYLERCRHLSLREVLDLDLVLARQYQRRHDFPEGVRALLIDKDRRPVWSPDRFEAVGPELVDAHFQPLG